MRPWNRATYLTKARELAFMLGHWHRERLRFPTQHANEDSQHYFRAQTFRDIVVIDDDTGEDEEGGEEEGCWRYIMPGSWIKSADDPPEADEPAEYIAYKVPRRVTDRPTTLWLMGKFLQHLNEETHPAFDDLKGCFNQILNLSPWVVREPQNEAEQRHALLSYLVWGR